MVGRLGLAIAVALDLVCSSSIMNSFCMLLALCMAVSVMLCAVSWPLKWWQSRGARMEP